MREIKKKERKKDISCGKRNKEKVRKKEKESKEWITEWKRKKNADRK